MASSLIFSALLTGNSISRMAKNSLTGSEKSGVSNVGDILVVAAANSCAVGTAVVGGGAV